ncbi:MAG TPA: endolytic transglycosylase MltG [Ktedonobacterales bacterium]|nr:endolytic transglycosylase MltG [Ktedonobacterales bacterium]
MKAFARFVTVVFTLVALAVGFAGATVALDVTQPTNAKEAATVQFEVKDGDTATSVAQRLQDEGLIRNALVFRLWARYKKLDSGLEKGVYLLSPSMSMDKIIGQLQQATPNQIAVTVPDGMRATQYPFYFQDLKNFDAKEFLSIAKTGIEPDGTKLWEKYWFIPQPGAKTKIAYVLEGYLYPAQYYFYPNDDATKVVEKMLDQFGIELCPGPDNKPNQYIYDAAQCRQHAATINGKNIFDLMRASYSDTKSDVGAIRDMLIMSSLTAREIKDYKDAPGIAAVYYNRYLHMIGKVASDTGLRMGADPTVQYARDNDKPPADGGKWWTPLADSGNNIAPNNPYNTYTQDGLPPGPIANPFWDEMKAAIAPEKSPYFYFVSDKCGKTYYAKTSADFETAKAQANNAKC